jgi:hypothetical protein
VDDRVHRSRMPLSRGRHCHKTLKYNVHSLASGGRGHVLSAAAHDQLKKILPLACTGRRAQSVKNIEEPVRAFVVGAAGAREHEPGKPLPLPDKSIHRRPIVSELVTSCTRMIIRSAMRTLARFCLWPQTNIVGVASLSKDWLSRYDVLLVLEDRHEAAKICKAG